MTSGSHQVVQSRELNNDGVVIFLVERSFLEVVSHEFTFQSEASAFLSTESQDVNSVSRGEEREKRERTSCFLTILMKPV